VPSRYEKHAHAAIQAVLLQEARVGFGVIFGIALLLVEVAETNPEHQPDPGDSAPLAPAGQAVPAGGKKYYKKNDMMGVQIASEHHDRRYR